MPIYKVDLKEVWIESYYVEADSPEEATAKVTEHEHMPLHGESIKSEHHATSIPKTIPDNYDLYEDAL